MLEEVPSLFSLTDTEELKKQKTKNKQSIKRKRI